jgi:hypothetical protein
MVIDFSFCNKAEAIGTVKPQFKAPWFNANPDLTRLILFPKNFVQVFEKNSNIFLKLGASPELAVVVESFLVL